MRALRRAKPSQRHRWRAQHDSDARAPDRATLHALRSVPSTHGRVADGGHHTCSFSRTRLQGRSHRSRAMRQESQPYMRTPFRTARL